MHVDEDLSKIVAAAGRCPRTWLKPYFNGGSPETQPKALSANFVIRATPAAGSTDTSPLVGACVGASV
jgi:hypothetical protein